MISTLRDNIVFAALEEIYAQVAQTMAVVAKPLMTAELSTEDEMAGVAVPPTVVDATTTVASDVLMEAATTVPAVPSTEAEVVPPTEAEVFLEEVLVVDKNETMVGSASSFDKDEKCVKAACRSCVGISRNRRMSASVSAKDLSVRIVAD